MTNARFETNVVPAGLEMTLEVAGHAGYAENGEDIVCSACSILTQALAAALIAMNPHDRHLIYREDESSAAASVWYCATDALEAERMTSMFSVAKAGFDMLAKKYPKNVCVTGEMEKKH